MVFSPNFHTIMATIISGLTVHADRNAATSLAHLTADANGRQRLWSASKMTVIIKTSLSSSRLQIFVTLLITHSEQRLL